MGRVHRFTPRTNREIAQTLFPELTKAKTRRVKDGNYRALLLQQITDAKIPAPEPELKFASKLGRKWRLDLAWPSRLIAVEIEGNAFGNVVMAAPGSWTMRQVKGGKKGQKERVTFDAWTPVRVGGRHNTGAGMQADCEKYSQAAILGWCVVRVTTTMIRDGIAINLLKQAFALRAESNVFLK